MDVVKALLDVAVKIAKDEKAVVIKIDPVVERKAKPELHKDLEKLGFKHRGFSVGFMDIQPRFAMVTDITADEETVFKSFNSRTKTSIKKATKYGLLFEMVGLDEMEKFNNLMEITGKRDGFYTRSKEYFTKLVSEMKKSDDAFLFLIKMYPQTTIKILLNEYSSTLKELEKTDRKIEKLKSDEKANNEEKVKRAKFQISEIEKRRKKISSLIEEIEPLTAENKEVVLSGAILTFCGEKAYYLYGASSNDFRELLSNYYMQWEMIKFSKQRGCTSYDFGGISGIMSEDDNEYGLFDFKLGFNSEIHEKVGEFDYILSPFVFYCVDVLSRRIKNLKIKLLRRNN